MRSSISLCMIVRDEADLLERCLQSAIPLVDEIVVVDTGSTDPTKQIASQYTSLIYDFTWIQDFSAARNFAIAQASGQWILILDADEYLGQIDVTALKGFLREHTNDVPTGIVLPVYNFVGEISSGKVSQSKAIRLFNRHPDLSFVRPIHEQLQARSGMIRELEYELPIYHSGYTTSLIESKQKNDRNEAIFAKMQKNGAFTCYDSFALGNEYFTQSRYEQALFHYRQANQPSQRNKTWLPLCFGNMISCQLGLQLYTEAFATIESALSRWPNSCDFYWLKGYLLARLGFEELAIDTLKMCLSKADASSEHPTWLISPNYGSTLPLQQLSSLFLKRQEIPGAVQCLSKLFYANPSFQTAFAQLLKLTASSEPAERIEAFILQLCPDPQGRQLSMIIETCCELGLREQAERFWPYASDELTPCARLHYALLHKNWSLAINALEEMESTPEIDKLVYEATLLWPERAASLTGRFSEPPGDNVTTIASAAMHLFRIGRYDLYDQAVQSYPEHFDTLANRLGDIFFEDRQFELALDYYSLMLSKGSLSANGFENLTRLYLFQNEIDEALAFAREGLRLDPERLALYTLLIGHSRVDGERKKLQLALIDVFPGIRDFPLLTNF
jgi:glycosyltransferase involved in cell wall biosynthesis